MMRSLNCFRDIFMRDMKSPIVLARLIYNAKLGSIHPG